MKSKGNTCVLWQSAQALLGACVWESKWTATLGSVLVLNPSKQGQETILPRERWLTFPCKGIGPTPKIPLCNTCLSKGFNLQTWISFLLSLCPDWLHNTKGSSVKCRAQLFTAALTHGHQPCYWDRLGLGSLPHWICLMGSSVPGKCFCRNCKLCSSCGQMWGQQGQGWQQEPCGCGCTTAPVQKGPASLLLRVTICPQPNKRCPL